MTRIRLTSARTATVHYRPHWLLKLFGREERDYEVRLEGWYWIDSTTGREVPAEVEREIERAVAQWDENRRAIEQYTILG